MRELRRRAAADGESIENVASSLLSTAVLESPVDDVKAELKKLRGDFAVAVQALLVASGRMRADDAQAWVIKKILAG